MCSWEFERPLLLRACRGCFLGCTVPWIGAVPAVGGYGWQQGHPGGGTVGVGEELLAQAAQRLQDYLASVDNPNGTVLFVYRQIQVRVPPSLPSPPTHAN